MGPKRPTTLSTFQVFMFSRYFREYTVEKARACRAAIMENL
jgi:hypothetical protein